MRITEYKIEVPNVLVKSSSTNYKVAGNITSPQQMAQMMNELFGLSRMAEEHAYMAALDCKGKLLGVFEVSHGSVNMSIVNPREVYMRALLAGASAVLVCHNHPSGVVTPSSQDDLTTKRLADAGEIIGVELLDHIVVGGDRFYSYRESSSLLKPRG